jgi:hypothetical protein
MFVVRGKSGKVAGRYHTKAEAERRIAQLKAGAARLRPFAFAGHRTSRSPGEEWETGAHSHGANDLILFADNTGELYPEKQRIIELLKGTIARGVYNPALARSTWNRWLMKAQSRYKREFGRDANRETMGVVARQDAANVIEEREHELIKRGEYGPVGAHSWPGQPKRHARAARLGHRRSAKSPAGITASSLKARGYDYWKSRPTLESGHFDNLKYNDGKYRVWVSRQSIEDYGGDRLAWLRDRLTVETNHGGRWR